jgi:hypothetical protein
MNLRHLAALLFTPTACFQAAGADSMPMLRFNRDIRPILSDKCFHCHGPDSKKREADLRLDVREAAIKDGHIIPGQPDKSMIIGRVISHDPDEAMPPPKSKLGALTAAEIATLRRWIAEGAEYEAHWSFIPLNPDSGKQTIDEVLDAGLQERGLEMQPEAAAETLIRRVSFDLTGLPPSPEQVTAFTVEYKASPAAYERLVDRLLGSPHYGERMAVDWLDIARYADSYGFQVDREREVWPWRDWVVRAFNENLRFDQFITWQLAGDLLPNPSDDQMLATAFNRLHQQESEGGSVEEEYRVEYVADRVQTVATAFLGLTFECARCHDHKYDPISQREYYGLFSMLQNIDEAGLYSFFTPSPPTPAMMLMDDSTKSRLAELRGKVEALEKEHGPVERAQELRVQEGEAASHLLAHFTFDDLKGNKLADEVNADAKAAATLNGENKLVPGKLGQAIQFTGDDAVETPLGNFARQDAFSVSLWLKSPDVKDRAVVFHRSRAWTDAASRGYELLIEEGRLKWSLIHFWPGNAISIRARDVLRVNEWTHVVVTYDGSSRASGLGLYVNGKAAPVEVVRDHLTKTIMGGGGDHIALGERFRDRGFKGGMLDDLRVFSRDLSLTSDAPEAMKKARTELYALQDAQREIMVMRELPQPKKAYVLTRGEYDKRTDEVGPVTPASLSPFPKGAPANRLGLAKWLTAPDHPLTARVTVNRVWQSVFGRGLVKTSEDFGSQGEKPLYPELLDGLSVRFMQSGWDMKALMKEIVLSRAYRQISIAGAKTMADDPENQWLARGPRFRLPAEMIRDNALSAAGLLNPKMGGTPVFPYEMTEAFKPVGPGAGDEVYRRSLYTNWRRTSPPPAMVAFDAPRRAVCSAKRERTDSPLQALILLNGVQYVEAARVLGERLHQETKGDVKSMIENGFLRCLGRRPDDREIGICQRLYREQLEHFKANTREAASLLKVGTARRESEMSAPEAAAATVLAQALMNHDECVVKR